MPESLQPGSGQKVDDSADDRGQIPAIARGAISRFYWSGPSRMPAGVRPEAIEPIDKPKPTPVFGIWHDGTNNSTNSAQ